MKTDKDYVEEFDKMFCTTIGDGEVTVMRWCKKDTPLPDVGRWLLTTLKAVREEVEHNMLQEIMDDVSLLHKKKEIDDNGFCTIRDLLHSKITPPNN